MNKMLKAVMSSALVALAVGVMPSLVTAAPAPVEAGVPAYTKADGISGNLNSVGSDTLNNLMTKWGEAFRKHYPNVKIAHEGKGSSTAPPALIEGTSQLGPMSRAMKDKEIKEFESRYFYKPTEMKVAVDALAVYAHKDNPVKSLTLKEVDGIFSSTRGLGGEDITTWGQVGATGEWANMPISLYGRNSASGTYGFFKKKALNKGDYKATVKEQPGSSAVIQGVASDKGGIGYSGVGYKTSGVKFVALGESKDKGYLPDASNALSGKYPLARFLYIYINKKKGSAVEPLTAEFIKFVVSKEGQGIVANDGYFPLPAKVSKEAIKTVSSK